MDPRRTDVAPPMRSSQGGVENSCDAEQVRVVRTRSLIENADTVSLVCALLERFPELASIRSLPPERTLRLTMALRQRLDRAAQTALIEMIDEHVRSFLSARARRATGAPRRV